jgi:hypothetical protein
VLIVKASLLEGVHIMMGTNTVNTRWGSKIEASIRRQWRMVGSESNKMTKRLAWSYQRFTKKGLLEARGSK